MLFNIMESTGLVHPITNIVFDDSLYAVTTDKEFVVALDNRFNSEITFPSYAETIRIEGSPYNYNRPLNVPNTVTNISNLFAKCSNYNQPTYINNGITNCVNMFSSAYNFNSDVIIEEGVENVSSLFEFLSASYPPKFNHTINFPNSVKNMYKTFFNCGRFNQPVTIPENVTTCASLLQNCYSFNSPINIQSNVRGLWVDMMLYGCSNFNQPITIPDSINNAYCMIYSCSNFNSPITFGNQESLHTLLQYCYNYNQPLTIPDTCNSISSMLSSCYRFNSDITFSNSGNLQWMNSTFSGCYAFNRPLNIPNGVTTCDSALASCTMYNSSVVIPETVQYTQYMFNSVNSRQYNPANSQFYPQTYEALRQPIYFFANNIAQDGAINMFQYCNTMTDLYIIGLKNNYQLNKFMRNNGINRCNIYTDGSGLSILYNTYMLSNGGKPTWTNDTANGCIYNTAVNLYIYNNWDGVVPTI